MKTEIQKQSLSKLILIDSQIKMTQLVLLLFYLSTARPSHGHYRQVLQDVPLYIPVGE